MGKVFTPLILLGACSAQIILNTFESRLQPRQRARTGRQDNSAVPGGVDFSGCQTDPDTGLCCVDQEEVCEENFEKLCSITFKQKAFNETVKKCYKPIEKVCNGQGPEECRTVYESSCTTKYVEKQPGKFV